MSTFQRAPGGVEIMAKDLLAEFDTHKSLVEHRVEIDFVFAWAAEDGNGNPKGPALRHGGVAALGLARIVPLKDRALGRGDAEISLDANWWNGASDPQRRALLDHELHHLTVKLDKKTKKPKFDDLGRPVLKMRRHDFEFGWFTIIAERHKEYSQERIQARMMVTQAGQMFWPELAGVGPGALVPVSSASLKITAKEAEEIVQAIKQAEARPGIAAAIPPKGGTPNENEPRKMPNTRKAAK